MPKVSVIMPVYNAGKYLRQCMDSLQKQTLREFEVICVDDGSTDRSLQILRDYSALDKRIHVFMQANQGAAVARNLGIEKAEGEYLLFLDSDDFFEKTLLEETYIAGAEVNADIVLFAARKFDHKIKKFENMPWTLKTELMPDRVFAASEVADRIFQVTTPSPWTKLFRKNFIVENRLQYQNLKNANDLSFVYTALFLAQKIRWLDRPLVNYRVNQGGSTQAKKKKYPKEFYFALKKLKQELESRNLLDIFSISFEQMAEETIQWNLKNIPYEIISREERDEIHQELGLLKSAEAQSNNRLQHHDAQPDISVVIPVYNVEPYLEACMRSVVHQTYNNIEIVCVNDGSTDNSEEILQHFAKTDKRIKVISKSKNEGLFLARKTGCEAAIGKYILFLDSDDYLDLGLCEELLKIISIDTDILHYGMKTSFFVTVPEEHKVWRNTYMKPHTGILKTENILQSAYIDKLFATSLVGKLFSKDLCMEAYRDAVNLEFYVGEDIYFFFILSSLAKKYEGIETDCKYHYCYGHGVSNQDTFVSIEKFEKYAYMGVLAEQIKKYLVDKNWYKKFQKAYKAVSERMLVDVLRIFSAQIKPEEKEKAAKIILKYWRGNEMFAKTVFKILKLDVTQFIERYDPIAEFVLENHLSAEQIKVSVIIPAYNVSEYLPTCLESVLNQTLQEIEVICVNDGSYDNTLDIFLEYSKIDERISIVNKKNRGQSSARNSGLSMAKGEYVYFIDSDDCLTLTALEDIYTRSKKDSLDIIYFNGLVIYENEEMQRNYADNRYYYYSYLNQKEPCSGQTLFQYLKQNKCYRVSPCMQMIRTKYLCDIGLTFHEGIIYEDNIFTFISLLKANRVLKVDEPYYLRRYREDSIMTDVVRAKNVVGYLTCLRQMLIFVDKEIQDELVVKEVVETLKSMLRSLQANYEKIDIEEKKKLECLNPIDKFWLDITVEPVKNSFENIIVKNITTKKISDESELLVSDSHKIIQFIAFVVRKTRGGIRCYEEHGLRYTLSRIKVKAINLIRKK